MASSAAASQDTTTYEPRARTMRAVARVADEGLSFAEIGRTGAEAAQRDALLRSCHRHGWNLAAVADELQMTINSNVIRALKKLAPEEYAAAQASGAVSGHSRRRRDTP